MVKSSVTFLIVAILLFKAAADINPAANRSDIADCKCTNAPSRKLISTTDISARILRLKDRSSLLAYVELGEKLVNKPHAPGTLAEKLGYYKSTDEGRSWQYKPDYKEEINEFINEFGSHPKNPNIAYRAVAVSSEGKPVHRLADGDLNYLMSGRELQRSTDDGHTWATQKAMLVGSNVKLEWFAYVYYHPVDTSTLYALCVIPGAQYVRGLYLSNDGGNTFSYLTEGGEDLGICESNPNVMYTTWRNGSILKSSNGGQMWDLVGENDFVRKAQPDALSPITVDTEDPNIVYVTCRSGVLRSNNGGKNWCRLYLGSNGLYHPTSVVIDLRDHHTILVGTEEYGLLVSRDEGCTWDRVNIPESSPEGKKR